MDLDAPFTSYVPLCASEAAAAAADAAGRGLTWRDCPPAGLALLPARYAAELLVRGTAALAFFLLCVPRGRVWFSAAGARTMYPYLLHYRTLFAYHLGLALLPVFAWGGIDPAAPWSDTMRAFGPRRAAGVAAVVAGAFGLAAGVMVFFTCDTVRWVTRPFVEPNLVLDEAAAWLRAKAAPFYARDPPPPEKKAPAGNPFI